MIVPDFTSARVDAAKILDYLLSPSHPGGQSKARFFFQTGFSREAWEMMADALRQHATSNPVVNKVNSPFGVKYTIDGPIQSPSGSDPLIRTVWIVEHANPVPRLITAHPL